MPRKLSEDQKKEIIELFKQGSDVKSIAIKYDFKPSTIVRQLKIVLGIDIYQKIKDRKSTNHPLSNKGVSVSKLEEQKDDIFCEIIPLTEGVEFNTQKNLSSFPIEDFKFPDLVYMIVDKKIELETKYLKDYPDWQFLSQDELIRKSIEIHFDLKIAKRFCNREQKVIKVPNTNVFKIVSPLLLSRGISRIVTPDKLIAL